MNSLVLLTSVLSIVNAFLARNKTQLMLNGSPVRFGGANLYWLGLDENENGIHFPSKFRIDDAFDTLIGMNVSYVRGHTLGISTGSSLSFWNQGKFNSSNLDAADYAIYRASQSNILLQIPLTDNYHYYHGGKHDFTDYLGLPEDAFWTDKNAIALFKQYIYERLNHVNLYTGKRAIDEECIAIWETGNELTSPSAWTIEIAQYIKSLDSNHLVMDGFSGIDAGTLQSESLDVYSVHFYPMDLEKLASSSALAAAAQKVYVAGEYGWSDAINPTYSQFLAAIEGNTNVSVSAFWSFFPHADTYGFVDHGDSFTVHFPGNDSDDMMGFVDRFMVHAAAMGNRSVLPKSSPFVLVAPTVNAPDLVNLTLTWRGAALANYYTIQISTSSSSGPWNTLCDHCADDLDDPWVVPGGFPTTRPFFLRIAGNSKDGSSMGPWSDVYTQN
jgi:mannan endo-1,4-beta-mannosidase